MYSATRGSVTILAAIAATVHAAGCASSDANVRMEPQSVAKRLGEPHCKASIPLSQDEVLTEARRWGDPNPQIRPEWVKIVADMRPGDQLRMIDCVRAKHNFYFAHIRNYSILAKMYTAILD